MKTGAQLIADERERQVSNLKWTPDHDDAHTKGELAWAAVCYAAPTLAYRREDAPCAVQFTDPWPWHDSHDKRPFAGNAVLPNTVVGKAERIRQLTKAGALIAAEIDRLRRDGDAKARE